MDRLMKGSPWYFDNHFLAMQRWERSEDFSDESFKKVAFWMHVSGLLAKCYIEELGEKSVATLWN